MNIGASSKNFHKISSIFLDCFSKTIITMHSSTLDLEKNPSHGTSAFRATIVTMVSGGSAARGKRGGPAAGRAG